MSSESDEDHENFTVERVDHSFSHRGKTEVNRATYLRALNALRAKEEYTDEHILKAYEDRLERVQKDHENKIFHDGHEELDLLVTQHQTEEL
jgi:hypothetical protein